MSEMKGAGHRDELAEKLGTKRTRSCQWPVGQVGTRPGDGTCALEPRTAYHRRRTPAPPDHGSQYKRTSPNKRKREQPKIRQSPMIDDRELRYSAVWYMR